MQKRHAKIGNEVRRIVEQAKREILADVTAGTVPHTCASFSELHDYTDANGYGGAFGRPFDNTEIDLWNAVQTEVDRWIKQGGLKEQTTMTTFSIETDNNITAFTAGAQTPEGTSLSPARRSSPSSPPTGPSPASPKSGTPSPVWCPSPT